MKLCKNCGREYEPKEELRTETRYGKSPREWYEETRICEDCADDLGIDASEYDE